MSIKEIADEFVALCKAGRQRETQKMFADTIVSIEPMEGPLREVRGIEAVRAKGEGFYANNTINEFVTEGPYLNGDQFAVKFTINATFKGGAPRVMNEIGLYTVMDGKIVEERFLY